MSSLIELVILKLKRELMLPGQPGSTSPTRSSLARTGSPSRRRPTPLFWRRDVQKRTFRGGEEDRKEVEQRGRLRPEAAAICGSRLYPTISRRADRVLCYATKLLPIIESPYYLDHLFVTAARSRKLMGVRGTWLAAHNTVPSIAAMRMASLQRLGTTEMAP